MRLQLNWWLNCSPDHVKRFHRALFVGLLACIAGNPADGLAQLNENDTLRYQFSTGLTGAYQRGNVDLSILRARMDLLVNPGKQLVYKGQSSGMRQRFGDFLADRDGLTRHFLYYNPNTWAYPFAMLIAEHSLRRKLNARVFGGIGVTVNLIRSVNHSLKVSMSGVYEASRYSADVLVDENRLSQWSQWRLTPYISGFHRVNQFVSLWYSGFLLMGNAPAPNHRLHLDAGMDLRISKVLNATINYQFTREAAVPFGIQRNDAVLTYGLRLLLQAAHPSIIKQEN